MRLTGNTKFSLPIIHPVTGQEVSAETLYNSCCDALGYQITDHIGDLILDNLQWADCDEGRLHHEIYSWVENVREMIGHGDE